MEATSFCGALAEQKISGQQEHGNQRSLNGSLQKQKKLPSGQFFQLYFKRLFA
ncbi:hypothetical protein FEDK69T_29900 [Flavobacterium enshiense DK69]|nr:hypothetical protein FEDK69T_29900 [Flavobacterium enshiense DK69]